MKNRDLTQEELKSLLHYDHDTGIFTWAYRPWLIGRSTTFNTRCAGQRTGFISPDGYICLRLHKKFYRLHRLAWFYVYKDRTYRTKEMLINKTNQLDY